MDVACQAYLTMGFPRQECWSGLPFPSPGDLPDPGIKPVSPTLQADSVPSETLGKPSSLVAQLVKNLPAMQEAWVQSLGWKDSMEKGKATHSSILAWRILWAV